VGWFDESLKADFEFQHLRLKYRSAQVALQQRSRRRDFLCPIAESALDFGSARGVLSGFGATVHTLATCPCRTCTKAE
jgi:hypothetical protein